MGKAQPMQSAALPTDPPLRIDAMDAARGLAVCGIVLLNIYNFAMPPAAYFNPLAYGDAGAAGLAIWAVESIFAQDAFRAIFAMLFGAGVAILFERGGPRPLRAHVARMAVLLVIGWAHAVVLNNGDVLRLYAVTGLLLPPLLRLNQRGLLIAVGVLAAVHCLALGWFAWSWLRYWWDVRQGLADPSALAMWQGEFGVDSAAMERGLVTGRESLGERVARRAFLWQGPLIIFAVFLPQTLAAMLLGVWGWRSELFQARWNPGRAGGFARILVLVALPPMVVLCALAFWSGFAGPVVGTTALVWSQPFAVALGLAYVAMLYAQWAGRRLTRGIGMRLAAAGRLSLSNYIGASVVMAALFHSWGLGWFGLVNRVEATLIALGVIALILTVSPLWSPRFGLGPFERLWRAGARALS